MTIILFSVLFLYYLTLYKAVSLNALAVLDKSFAASYLSQVKAEFPNPNHDGPFSDISKKTWIKQLQDIQLILGKLDDDMLVIAGDNALDFSLTKFVAYAKAAKITSRTQGHIEWM